MSYLSFSVIQGVIKRASAGERIKAEPFIKHEEVWKKQGGKRRGKIEKERLEAVSNKESQTEASSF